MHIVSDLSHFRDELYWVTICSLGVIGTRYVRDSNPLPAELNLFPGQTKSYTLPHIYSELEIGTKLAINVREKENLSNLLTLTNREDSCDLLFDLTNAEPLSSFEIVLESYNTLSSV